jgi:hypothetical protein
VTGFGGYDMLSPAERGRGFTGRADCTATTLLTGTVSPS